MVRVQSWGRLSQFEHTLTPLSDPTLIASTVQHNTPGIAIGMGRSYGDVGLNPGGHLWGTTQLDHFISFDNETGRLVCEAGTLLRDIQQTLIPRGWALPVTPGTQWVTVGGAIANDIHGKNHHVRGSFGDHVQRIRLIRTSGEIIECGPNLNPEWFSATVGGLGLTGVIAETELQLHRVKGPWLTTETIPYAHLGEFFELADSSERGWEHTVSWIDCIHHGRGLFMRANPCEASEGPAPKNGQIPFPVAPPFSLVNQLTLRPFNLLYHAANKRKTGQQISHYEPFFYPLDRISNWNKMYGPKGFYQYQSVVPRNCGQDAVLAMLKEISRSGDGSFLAVLKTFGERQPLGMLSFPQPGVTLALDFPNRGARTLKLFDRLDAIVKEAKGRIYPAKDARMPRELFESGYPMLEKFRPYRDIGISSAMSRRLLGS